MTYREKVEFLLQKECWRGSGEQMHLQRMRASYEKHPEFVPTWNSQVLIDACMRYYERIALTKQGGR